MGEGAGVLVLEEYEHARKRGANILGEIAGYGTTCDAYHITAPHPEAKGAAAAITAALKEACWQPDEKLYINAHGTSTPLNDKVETLAIKRSLGEIAYQTPISSTKSMTGHMLGAAGAVEAIICTLALQNGMLPPTIGYAEPDPDCDLDYVPNAARKSDISLALSTSLGFGGHNACLAIRNY
jgi:3-oxoacyl-[acyl-carrier-protein] synthase II